MSERDHLHQCCRRTCGHVYWKSEFEWSNYNIGRTAVCPECGHDERYTLKPDGTAQKMSDRDEYRDGIYPTTVRLSPRLGQKMKHRLLAAKARKMPSVTPLVKVNALELGDLISEIRHQCAHGVPTWGNCSTDGCTHGARGSRTCIHCLEQKLMQIVGPTVAAEFVEFTKRAAKALKAVYEAAGH